MKRLPINHGTYWSAGELRQLKQLAKSGCSISYIATILKRTESACQSRLLIIRTAVLLESDDNKTVREIKL